MATQRQEGSGPQIQVGRDVSGGSVVNAGGVTIIINQGPQPEPKQEQPATVGGLLGRISDLKPQEHRSFMKFIHTALGDLPLSKVDASTMKRVNAYVIAIYGRRA